MTSCKIESIDGLIGVDQVIESLPREIKEKADVAAAIRILLGTDAVIAEEYEAAMQRIQQARSEGV